MATAIGVMHEENGVFGVSFPDFPGVVTGADTEEEAARKADEVLTFHVAGMAEDGDPIPVPRTLRELWRDPEFEASVLQDKGIVVLIRYEEPKKPLRINVSMDEKLIKRIDRAAGSVGLSRSGFLSQAAEAYLQKGL